MRFWASSGDYLLSSCLSGLTKCEMLNELLLQIVRDELHSLRRNLHWCKHVNIETFLDSVRLPVPSSESICTMSMTNSTFRKFGIGTAEGRTLFSLPQTMHAMHSGDGPDARSIINNSGGQQPVCSGIHRPSTDYQEIDDFCTAAPVSEHLQH